jgi:hypothetical protein
LRETLPHYSAGGGISASLYNSSAFSGYSSDKEFLETKDIVERRAKIAEPSTKLL